MEADEKDRRGSVSPILLPAVASIPLHPNRGTKSTPQSARVPMVIAKVSNENRVAADVLAGILEQRPRVDHYVLLRFFQENASCFLRWPQMNWSLVCRFLSCVFPTHRRLEAG